MRSLVSYYSVWWGRYNCEEGRDSALKLSRGGDRHNEIITNAYVITFIIKTSSTQAKVRSE